MKIVDLKDLIRKDNPIEYRRMFTGSAVLELMDRHVEKRIEFSLEHSPLGDVCVNVTFLDKLDYPLLPVINQMKHYIIDLNKRGQLP